MIRNADPERDAAGCLALYGPYIRDSAISFEERVPTEDEFAARMRVMMETHPWVVFDTGSEIAGYAYASPHRTRAAYRWATDVAIYVAAAHQRGGIGRRLYEALFERLREQGFRVACAGVTLPNEASVGLHRAVGFEPVGVYRRIGWKSGGWHDVAWFQLSLLPQDSEPPQEPGPPR